MNTIGPLLKYLNCPREGGACLSDRTLTSERISHKMGCEFMGQKAKGEPQEGCELVGGLNPCQIFACRVLGKDQDGSNSNAPYSQS